MNKEYLLDEISGIDIRIKPGNKVFIYGDLGSGKTTLVKKILNADFGLTGNIQSPTYIHYKKYGDSLFHFDLYRLESYNDFVNIGGEEILENDNNTCFIEWPELLKGYYEADIEITLSKIEDDPFKRKIKIVYN